MKLLTALAVFLAINSLAYSATFYVPDNYPTIQDAIAATANGDEIIVRPGVYQENIGFMGKAITLKSEHGPDVTTIYGTSRDHSVVVFQKGEGLDTILEGFLIMNGQKSGIQCLDSSPTIRNNTIYQCEGRIGGGIACTNSSALIQNSLITRCEGLSSCEGGGGIGCSYSNVTISGCRIYDNHDNDGYATGGGIYCFESDMIIENNLVSKNGCYAYDQYYGRAYGGGIYVNGGSSSLIKGNEISFNTVWSLSGAETGSGICIYNATATVDDNDIFSNSGGAYGGGISCYSEYGGITSATITNNRIYYHSANWGAGLSCWFATGVVSGNFIGHNEAYYHGGGIDCITSSSMTIVNNIIFKNKSRKYGGGIYFSGEPILTNNTLFNNTASLEGGGIWCKPSGPTYITNTILWNNDSPQGPEIFVDPNGDIPDVTYCNVLGGWPGVGNIDAAPVFADPAERDFHLNWDSPCKDTGDSGAPGLPTVDGEGNPRISGASVDMGADEFYPHFYCRGDVIPGQTVRFHVVGEPGQAVKVALGANVLDPPWPTPHGDLFIWPILARWPIGAIPGNGIRILPATVPPGWISGEEYPFQAQVGVWGNLDTRLSNLLTLTVE